METGPRTRRNRTMKKRVIKRTATKRTTTKKASTKRTTMQRTTTQKTTTRKTVVGSTTTAFFQALTHPEKEDLTSSYATTTPGDLPEAVFLSLWKTLFTDLKRKYIERENDTNPLYQDARLHDIQKHFGISFPAFRAMLADRFKKERIPHAFHAGDFASYKRFLVHAYPNFWKEYLKRAYPVYLPFRDRTRHTFLVASSGSGKSEVMKCFLLSILQRKKPHHHHFRSGTSQNGTSHKHPPKHGLILIDPHGDLAQEVARQTIFASVPPSSSSAPSSPFSSVSSRKMMRWKASSSASASSSSSSASSSSASSSSSGRPSSSPSPSPSDAPASGSGSSSFESLFSSFFDSSSCSPRESSGKPSVEQASVGKSSSGRSSSFSPKSDVARPSSEKPSSERHASGERTSGKASVGKTSPSPGIREYHVTDAFIDMVLDCFGKDGRQVKSLFWVGPEFDDWAQGKARLVAPSTTLEPNDYQVSKMEEPVTSGQVVSALSASEPVASTQSDSGSIASQAPQQSRNQVSQQSKGNHSVRESRPGRSGGAMTSRASRTSTLLTSTVPLDELVYFHPSLDPLGKRHPVINPLDIAGKGYNENQIAAYAQFLANALVTMLGEGGALTPNMQALVFPCLCVLLGRSGSTLLDLKRFMVDGSNEDLVVLGKRSTNPVHASFFQHDFVNGNFTPTRRSIASKLQAILNDPVLARIIASPRSTINLEGCMNEGSIVIMNLSGLGSRSTEVLGRLIVAMSFGFATNRVHLPPQKRTPVHLLIDEAGLFVNDDGVEPILTQARKFKLHLTLAVQHVGQRMSTKLQNAILGNTEVKLCGKASHHSAQVMSRNMHAQMDDFRDLGKGKFLVKSGNSPALRVQFTDGHVGLKTACDDREWERRRNFFLKRYCVEAETTATTATTQRSKARTMAGSRSGGSGRSKAESRSGSGVKSGSGLGAESGSGRGSRMESVSGSHLGSNPRPDVGAGRGSSGSSNQKPKAASQHGGTASSHGNGSASPGSADGAGPKYTDSVF